MVAGRVRGASAVAWIYVLAVLSLALSCVAALACGATNYSFTQIVGDADVQRVVLFVRLPRVLFAAIVGGGLAVTGACYQAIFKNHLASPFSLGVSSAAALGASLSLLYGTHPLFAGADTAVCAIVGALCGISGILACSRRDSSAERLLLVGIVFSFLCSSALTLLQYLADYSQLFRVTRWLMGGVPIATFSDVVVGSVLLVVVGGWAWCRARNLDLMLFGDELARTKGVNTFAVRRVAFLISSLFIGWSVSMCGVIGFVGIIVPALIRLAVGISHRALVPLSCVLGATLVVVCDMFGRVIVAPFEVPAGVFTSLVGGPLFIVLLMKRAPRRSLG